MLQCSICDLSPQKVSRRTDKFQHFLPSSSVIGHRRPALGFPKSNLPRSSRDRKVAPAAAPPLLPHLPPVHGSTIGERNRVPAAAEPTLSMDEGVGVWSECVRGSTEVEREAACAALSEVPSPPDHRSISGRVALSVAAPPLTCHGRIKSPPPPPAPPPPPPRQRSPSSANAASAPPCARATRQQR